MSQLSPRDRALVGLGAALGSNCIPCVEHHVPAARNAGLSDDEIRSAINIADNIRMVPARRVLARAGELLDTQAADASASTNCEMLDGKASRPASGATAASAAAATGGDCATASMKPATGGCC